MDVLEGQSQRELGRISAFLEPPELSGRPLRDKRTTRKGVNDAGSIEPQLACQGEGVGHSFCRERQQRVVDELHSRTRPNTSEPDRALADRREDAFGRGSCLLGPGGKDGQLPLFSGDLAARYGSVKEE